MLSHMRVISASRRLLPRRSILGSVVTKCLRLNRQDNRKGKYSNKAFTSLCVTPCLLMGQLLGSRERGEVVTRRESNRRVVASCLDYHFRKPSECSSIRSCDPRIANKTAHAMPNPTSVLMVNRTETPSSPSASSVYSWDFPAHPVTRCIYTR